MKIGIITNVMKDKDLEVTKLLIQKIKFYGFEYILNTELKMSLEYNFEDNENDDLIKNSDIIISLGGDGTFLNTARHVFKHKIPILGINLGTLGFMTEIEVKEIDMAILALKNGNYKIEKRMMLKSKLIRDKNVLVTDYALNDIVISRGSVSRLVQVKAYINDKFVDMFPADGLIISTPTGSTAYSLSAGGPIVEPDVNLILITPICPHILYSRSIVTTDDRVIKAIVDASGDLDAMVTIDGQIAHEVLKGDEVLVEKANDYVNIVRIKEVDYFNILRTKFYYRGKA